MTPRTRLALVFGGRSGEHDVSVVSARSVARAVDPARYELVPMAIDREGRWAAPEVARDALERSGDRTDEVIDFAGSARLDPRLLDGSIDVVVPVLHGPFGEDGTIQGLCEMLSLPYTGCGVSGSATAMDKLLTKRLLVAAGLATPRYAAIDGPGWREDRAPYRERCLALGLPLFVKPARLGSSVGISKVKRERELDDAVAAALLHDHHVIVEEGVDGREIEVAVLDGDPPVTSVPGEVVPGHEFYDYADKYLDDSCRLLAPAPLDEATAEAARGVALAAFRAVGCDGMGRVDLFLERAADRLLVNEINTIPGFTAISMFPRLLELSGIPYRELLDRLIEYALQRHRQRSALAEAVRRSPGEQGGGREA